MDDGIAINLAKVPEKVKTVVILTKVSDVHKFKD
jgi:hypothetical protein